MEMVSLNREVDELEVRLPFEGKLLLLREQCALDDAREHLAPWRRNLPDDAHGDMNRLALSMHGPRAMRDDARLLPRSPRAGLRPRWELVPGSRASRTA
jgi:hypothetical protein